MDGREFRQKLTPILQKYRYVALVLFAGIFLMLLPGGNDAQQLQTDTEPIQTQTPGFEERLEQFLCQMDGAGKVRVFLSQAAGEEIFYQLDTDTAADSIRQATVLVTGTDRSESGLIQRIDPPVYQGAVILCQGADNAAIRLSITQAVANATGLRTDQISVLKMK